MSTRRQLLIRGLGAAGASLAAASEAWGADTVLPLNLRPLEEPLVPTIDLARMDGWDFHSTLDAYIRSAVRLQALGSDRAIRLLRRVSREWDLVPMPWRSQNEALAMLCRLLFRARPESAYRAPLLGAPHYLGRTTAADWPLDPWEIVDGIPFFIVTGYTLQGRAERAEDYLAYCVENCAWADHRFFIPLPSQKDAAVAKLLGAPKWKRPLERHERNYLSRQI